LESRDGLRHIATAFAHPRRHEREDRCSPFVVQQAAGSEAVSSPRGRIDYVRSARSDIQRAPSNAVDLLSPVTAWRAGGEATERGRGVWAEISRC